MTDAQERHEAIDLDAQAEKRAFVKEAARFRSENEHLRQSLRRSELQLHQYQLRYPEATGSNADATPLSADDDELPPWLASPVYVPSSRRFQWCPYTHSNPRALCT